MRLTFLFPILAAFLLTACSREPEQPVPAPQPPAAQTNPAPPAAPVAEPAAEQYLSSAEVVAQSRLAVVLVRTPKTQGVGFLVNPNGIVATTYQLVKDASVIGVKLASGDIYPATQIHAQDPLKNLALIRISGFKLPALPLQDSDKAAAGQEVVVLTDPAGAGTMVTAKISAIGDISTLDSKRRGHLLMQLQTLLPPSSSGAPVLDNQGKVVGLAASFGKQTVAVPSNYIAGLLNNPQPVALRPGSEPPGQPVPAPGSTPETPAGPSEPDAVAVAEAEPAAPTPAPSAKPKQESAKTALENSKVSPPRVAQSMRQVRRVYVTLAGGGKIRTDRAAGPAICKPKVEEELQEEDFVIAPNAARADAVLRLSGTHKTGCQMPLGCGREIMQYRANLRNSEGDLLWQMAGNESAVGFDEVCQDIAEDLAESLSEARER